MAWTYPQIAAAYSTLSPVPTNLTDGAATLNAQTKTITIDVPVQMVAGYLGVAGKLASFMQWAGAPPTGASTESISAAAELAFAFEHPTLFPVFQMTNPNVLTIMQSWLGALVSPGVTPAPLTTSDQTAILALASQTVLVWQPTITVGDLQTARV